jgi:hypothetical protein
MIRSQPRLNGDFSLVPVELRVRWRDALARDMLGNMRLSNGNVLLPHKIDEHVLPTTMLIELLVKQGVTDPYEIEQLVTSAETRKDNETRIRDKR